MVPFDFWRPVEYTPWWEKLSEWIQTGMFMIVVIWYIMHADETLTRFHTCMDTLEAQQRAFTGKEKDGA